VFPNAGIRDSRCTCREGVACDSPGKHPAIVGWQEAATTDPAVIQRWFKRHPLWNLGLPTGHGMAVLDVDRKHGGIKSLRELGRRHGDLPRTVVSRTGGRGLHFLLLLPPGVVLHNTVSKIAPGLDIRGDGGQIVLPPSLHFSGNPYRWDPARTPWNTPLGLMSDWMVEKALAAEANARVSRNAALGAGVTPQGRPTEEWVKLVGEGVREGGRNDAVARLTGHLLRKNVSSWITLALMQAWNAARCRPPLSEREVNTIVNSIATKELRRRQRESQDG
jgi:hypothetical protein